MFPPAPVPLDSVVGEVRQAAETLGLEARYRELDRSPAFPRKEFRALGEAHLLGLRIPTALGGRGLPMPRVGAALYWLAYSGGTTFAKLALQPEFSSILADHGATSLVDRYFRPLVAGQTLIGNQITEPGAGSDISALATRAVRQGTDYVLDGTKSEVAFAMDADAAIVYARVLSEGDSSGMISAFLIPQGLPGIRRTVGEDLGERWMRRGSVTYENVRVSVENRIGEEGRAFGYVRPELMRERLLLAAIYLGVARRSWEETVEYVGNRIAFDRPLSQQQGVAFPLVEDWVRSDAAWLYVARSLERMERGDVVEGEAALAKWFAYEAALTTLDHAIQFHGGRGYSRELPHEQRWRDVRSGGIAHGPSEIMHLVGARALWPRTRQGEATAGQARPT